MQPYESISLQDASQGFLRRPKGTSPNENIGDEVLDKEEGNSVGLPKNNAVAGYLIFHRSEVTYLPKDF